MRALLTALLTAVLLTGSAVFATASPAAVTFGDSLTLSPQDNAEFITVLAAREPDGSEHAGSPISGVITSLTLRSSGDAGDVNVLVERRTTPLSAATDYTKIGEQVIAVPAHATGVNTTAAVRILVQAGDVLGVDLPATIHTTVNYAAATTNLCTYRYTAPAQALGASASFSDIGCNLWWPAVRATVEPDADGDGFGDETQDFCPTDAARQDACPAPPTDLGPTLPPGPLFNTIDLAIAPVKASRAKPGKSVVRSFVVHNYNTVGSASGVLVTAPSTRNIKSVKFLSGCRAYPRKPRICEIAALPPGEAVTVKLRATASKSGKFALPLSVSHRGPDGNPANNKASTKVRFLVR